MIGRNGWVAMALVLCATAEVRAGFISVSLAVGTSGANGPSSERQFTIDVPNGNSVVIDQVLGAGTVVAGTTGGRVYFGSAGVPIGVALDTGGAYIASAGAPPELTDGAAGLGTISPWTDANDSLNVAHLNITVLDDGHLSVSGIGTRTEEIPVPRGGWWVIGLGPVDKASDPVVVPSGGDPVIVPSGPQTAATPEPTALGLAAVGAVSAAWWRGRGLGVRKHAEN